MRGSEVRPSVRTPADYGFECCRPEDLAGGDAAHNAHALRAVLRGEDHGAHRDACLLLGAALALEVAGRVATPFEGVERAALAIADGSAAGVLGRLAAFGAHRAGSRT